MKKLENTIVLARHKYAPELNKITFAKGTCFDAPQCTTFADAKKLVRKQLKTKRVYKTIVHNTNDDKIQYIRGCNTRFYSLSEILDELKTALKQEDIKPNLEIINIRG